MNALQWYDRWLKVLIPVIFVAALVGCAVPYEDRTPASDERTSVFQEIGADERHAPKMFQLTHEGHTYLVIGNGYEEGFILHSESCPHPSHIGLGHIY